jgi:L-ribulokinase
MQIYADILGKPLKVSASEQTCALGAALFGAAASGRLTLEDAQANCCQVRDRIYEPISENQAVYERLYALYRTLHDAFGTNEWDGKLNHVMKEVVAIRAETRSSS